MLHNTALNPMRGFNFAMKLEQTPTHKRSIAISKIHAIPSRELAKFTKFLLELHFHHASHSNWISFISILVTKYTLLRKFNQNKGSVKNKEYTNGIITRVMQFFEYIKLVILPCVLVFHNNHCLSLHIVATISFTHSLSSLTFTHSFTFFSLFMTAIYFWRNKNHLVLCSAKKMVEFLTILSVCAC